MKGNNCEAFNCLYQYRFMKIEKGSNIMIKSS